MMVSTRGRYALRVMTDLAENGKGEFIPLREIVERQGISKKYIESIMTLLSKAGLLEGSHGKGGGYRLSRPPEEYSVLEILKVTEGTLAPVSCLTDSATPCENANECRTRPMWCELDGMIESFFASHTLADLARR